VSAPLTLGAPVRAKRSSNRYCGPSAISAVTGFDTAETAALLRHISGRKFIKGSAIGHVLTAFARLGIRAESIADYLGRSARERPTLQAWAADSVYKRGTDVVLTIAGDHYELLQGDHYVCGVVGKVVPLAEAPYRRHKLAAAYRLTRTVPLPDIKKLLPKPRRKTAEEKRAQSTATLVRRLARLHGIEIEVEFGNVIVWGPTWAEGWGEENCDPFYGDHSAESWPDALKMVEEYIRLKDRKPHWFAKED